MRFKISHLYIFCYYLANQTKSIKMKLFLLCMTLGHLVIASLGFSIENQLEMLTQRVDKQEQEMEGMRNETRELKQQLGSVKGVFLAQLSARGSGA